MAGGRNISGKLRSAKRSRDSGLRLLLAAHSPDRVRPLDRLAAKSLSGEGSGGITAYNARLLGGKVQYEIEITVFIHILDVTYSVSLDRCIWSEIDSRRVNSR